MVYVGESGVILRTLTYVVGRALGVGRGRGVGVARGVGVGLGPDPVVLRIVPRSPTTVPAFASVKETS